MNMVRNNCDSKQNEWFVVNDERVRVKDIKKEEKVKNMDKVKERIE